MAQEYATGTEALPKESETTHAEVDVPHGESHSDATHPDVTHIAEQFGAGASIAVLVGALAGVAAMAVLGTSAGAALVIASGIGLILAPLAGIAVTERGE
ncbi:hypothetical protein [Halopelagius longus]|uniref:Glycine zipper-like domain-containing protein n=1 Tax=Halopelagius longus TaxID=1236180 RepID=A0A1H0Z3N6_9EURY|nr:hypothetical protein [Halopelagius longus]RDI72813.1 hypothetical protein DWB78_14355 [Halopelagius longus]SDQ21974.1 hypothetical protein SAMN05216278_0993 [Halopelagius longus]